MRIDARRLWRRLTAIIGCGLSLVACGKELPRPNTAGTGVHVLQRDFEIPGLDRKRRLRIYLPPDYEASERRYPVLYMHDGQNLFDEATSYAGEWGIDETLDQLFNERDLALIVVGIDNGGDKRMNELSPWPNGDFGAAEGHEYMEFVVNDVKDYVDRNYRTLPDAANTAIMGSSMGGLISHYAVFEYPEVFTKAGIFSPSYWFSDEVWDYSHPHKLSPDARLYVLMGEDEGGEGVRNMQRMTARLAELGLTKDALASRVVPGGEHNEAFWRAEFAAAITWLFEPR